ncbi:MAG: hypothetical protein HOJ57_39635 [Lentisphaerae bacterium]|jgi:hypothetical protein|nr:hypothetical protein [Lentisphaerota bacterium]MBT4822365.1 hypothetical protein [Lentisphaerota bacterium]MBT5612116.1 hypothetical protein [Lentisphaerota bacterium]MBT7058785.1 hypothetical protein [Lentisphaerota bacterium]
MRINTAFPRYTGFAPAMPVWCLTPNEGRCIHRFFDTSPISPSGRYAAVFRLPNEHHHVGAGVAGHVVLIDLENGTESVVAETFGWEPQMGPNLNWGVDDHSLVFNDVDVSTWTPQLVHLDPLRGTEKRTTGAVYHVSPDGRYAAAANSVTMRRTQCGYGVWIPDDLVRRNVGARDDDGLFITDLQTGERTLLLSLAKAVKCIPELDENTLDNWEIYGFHSKWSPQGDRLIFTVRRRLVSHQTPLNDMAHLRFDVLTLRPDGTDIHNAVPADQWEKGGHHINWFPDGTKLSMNLSINRDGMRLCQVGYDGSDLQPMFDDVVGSGHPSLHPNGRHIVTDSYAQESVAFGDGTVPLRWIDRETGREEALLRIGARTEPCEDGALRVDPHPAWDRTWRYLVFNGVAGDNTRRVFLADMKPLLNR